MRLDAPLLHAAAVLAIAGAARAQCPTFDPPGLSGNAFAMAVFQGELYVGGDFTSAGDRIALRIARWDGSAWSDVGGGVAGGEITLITALRVFDDGSGPALYAAGSFTEAGGVPASNVARWNGTSWSALGAGTDRWIASLATLDEDGPGPLSTALFAAGSFQVAGGASAKHVARWNGSAWSALGAGTNAPVSSLASVAGPLGRMLCAGGEFTTAGSVAAAHVASWDGQAWAPLASERGASGVDGRVESMVYFGDIGGPALYVGGDFTSAGGVAAARVARWDGKGWSSVGDGVGGTPLPRVLALAHLDGDGDGTDELWVGGTFLSAGSKRASGPSSVAIDPVPFRDRSETLLARWDGQVWTLGGHMGDSVRCLIEYAGELYAGGQFTIADGRGANRIARFDTATSEWRPLTSGSGMSGVVRALASVDLGRGSGGPALFAAGDFAAAGTTAAYAVARWDGSAWDKLGTGMDDSVRALCGGGGFLYAGGDFRTAGGAPAERVARWDGSAWSALGEGMGAAVLALTVLEGDVWAGGSFTHAGDVGADHVARWDGSSWSRAGAGFANDVRALAVHDDGTGPALYAGADSGIASGRPGGIVARWTGAEWEPLGPGFDGPVLALASFDAGGGPQLFAAGEFTTAEGTSVRYVARWDGSGWDPLGAGLDGAVHALVALPGAIFAGGSFASAGGVPVSNVARWDGSAWSAFGSGAAPGPSYTVLALSALGGRVFGGGGFTAVDLTGGPSARSSSFVSVLGCTP